MNHKNVIRYLPHGPLYPLVWLFIHNWKSHQNIKNKTSMNFCWKYLDNSQNNCEGLTQWAFLSLGTILTKKNSNLKNLRNRLQSNICIDYDRWNHKIRHPRRDLPHTFGGRKYICPVWIRPTEKFLTYPRISFVINERW